MDRSTNGLALTVPNYKAHSPMRVDCDAPRAMGAVGDASTNAARRTQGLSGGEQGEAGRVLLHVAEPQANGYMQQAHGNRQQAAIVPMREPNACIRFVLRMGICAAMHPVEYAKVLMQLGYEPMPARVARNWLGKNALVLPNIHKYIKYIQCSEGFYGLYRGLGARLIGGIFSALLSGCLPRLMGMREYRRNAGESPYQFKEYLWNMLRNGIIITTGVLVSQPFYVVAVRQMAQFVGREVVYGTVPKSIAEIVGQEGVAGLYAGLVPRLLYDLSVLFITSTSSSILHRGCKLSPVHQQYNTGLLQYVATLAAYPLQVVAACMASTGARLAACTPPYMPVYRQWTDCLMDLYTRGDHVRGALPFWRPLPKIHMHISENSMRSLSRFISDHQ